MQWGVTDADCFKINFSNGPFSVSYSSNVPLKYTNVWIWTAHCLISTVPRRTQNHRVNDVIKNLCIIGMTGSLRRSLKPLWNVYLPTCQTIWLFANSKSKIGFNVGSIEADGGDQSKSSLYIATLSQTFVNFQHQNGALQLKKCR